MCIFSLNETTNLVLVERMTSKHWSHQSFDLLGFLAHRLTTHNLLEVVEWSNQKFVGPGLQAYGMATPLLLSVA